MIAAQSTDDSDRKEEARSTTPDRGSIMKVVGSCRVVDALGEWGSHNTPWRAKRQISDASEGADFALRTTRSWCVGFSP
jgi:hypothetical protein